MQKGPPFRGERDWLAELRGATKDLDSFKNLVTVVAKEAPGLREEVCRLAGELPGGIREWTDEAFFAEEVLREAHKAEAYFFGPESQPRVEDSKPTEPKTIEELKPV
jgi:hypothetical protein